MIEGLTVAHEAPSIFAVMKNPLLSVPPVGDVESLPPQAAIATSVPRVTARLANAIDGFIGASMGVRMDMECPETILRAGIVATAGWLANARSSRYPCKPFIPLLTPMSLRHRAAASVV